MKFKSALVTQASGSIGGMTASHNRGGMYFRARSIPTNPNSAFQQAVRGFVASLTSIWNNVLTADQGSGWIDYADAVPMVDRLGEPRNIGGLAHFVRSNVPRLQAGLDPVYDAPLDYNLGEFSNPLIGTVSEATQLVGTSFVPADEWANEDGSAMLILVSRPKNPTVNYFKGPYRYAGMIEGDSGTPPTSPATVTAPFAFVAGQRLFVQYRVSRADGRLSLPFRATVLAGA